MYRRLLGRISHRPSPPHCDDVSSQRRSCVILRSFVVARTTTSISSASDISSPASSSAWTQQQQQLRRGSTDGSSWTPVGSTGAADDYHCYDGASFLNRPNARIPCHRFFSTHQSSRLSSSAMAEREPDYDNEDSCNNEPTRIASAHEEEQRQATANPNASLTMPTVLEIEPAVLLEFVNQLQQAATWKVAASTRHVEETSTSIGTDADRQRSRPPRTSQERGEQIWDAPLCCQLVEQYEQYLVQLLVASKDGGRISSEPPHLLLHSNTVMLALKVLLKSQLPHFATKLRLWEQAWGELNQTTLTDHLSLRLLTANAKAGHVQRVLSLLQLRQQRNYRPRLREFQLAITAIRVAQHQQQQSSTRNIFVPDVEHTSQPTTHMAQNLVTQLPLDNPTRWLDAILINMHQRNVPLASRLAAQMIQCYASGYTGKAVHHFYRIVRQPVDLVDNGEDDAEDNEIDYQGMPRQYYYRDGVYQEYPVKVQVEYHKASPPYYKIPSHIGQQTLRYHNNQGWTKLEQESNPQYSPALAAAFAFADSIQLGVAHHAPIRLNTQCYNALLQVCVQRGALWRAKQILDTMIIQQHDNDSGKPDVCSYNLFLVGLSRVGDVTTMQEYTTKLISTSQLTPDAYTVRAIVDGLLNVGDMAGAITVVQDFFNQHGILPPYTTHLKILELCLAQDLPYEAKRHLYFVQQLWKWQPNAYHSESIVKLMNATQRNPQLQRPALEALFAYFGERLSDKDFF